MSIENLQHYRVPLERALALENPRQHQGVLSAQICSLFQEPPSPSVTGITCLMLCHCCGFRIEKHFLLNKKKSNEKLSEKYASFMGILQESAKS